MEFDMSDLIAAISAILIALGGVVMHLFANRIRQVEDDHKDLSKSQQEHEKEFAKYREYVARSYPTREEILTSFDEVKKVLEKILDKLDTKADKP